MTSPIREVLEELASKVRASVTYEVGTKWDKDDISQAEARIREIVLGMLLYPNTVKKLNEKWLQGYMKCRDDITAKIKEGK